mmetsp:Transcript_95396/g.221414  ORF Transcript_95396/g.221414 Transcript_95396/m.221414 type:complete len:236 (-) Transcript_95396:529-1236(-)
MTALSSGGCHRHHSTTVRSRNAGTTNAPAEVMVRSSMPRLVNISTSTCPHVSSTAVTVRGIPHMAPDQPRAFCMTRGTKLSSAVMQVAVTVSVNMDANTRLCLKKTDKVVGLPWPASPSGKTSSSGSGHLSSRTTSAMPQAAAWNQPGIPHAPNQPRSWPLPRAASAMPRGGPQKSPCERHMPKRTVQVWRTLLSQISPIVAMVRTWLLAATPARLRDARSNHRLLKHGTAHGIA